MPPSGFRQGSRAAVVLIVLIGAVLYGNYLRRYICFAVGGADSSGYANAARALSRGRLVAPIEALSRFGLAGTAAPAFTPLGLVRGPVAGTTAPLYPVGFPLHLAAAAALLGWQTGPYLVSPILAMLCLPLVWLVGRELGLSAWFALAPAAILAACPAFIFQAIQPMSDVAAGFWCLAAVLAALRSRSDARWAFVAGFAFGVAVLVRPLDVLLTAPLLFALRLEWRSVLRFALGAAPCAAALAIYNRVCFGGFFESGYGLTGHWYYLGWSHFPSHFVNYTLWTSGVLTPLVCLGWVVALFHPGIPRRHRGLFFSWFGVFFVFYCFYAPGDAWWYTRFLLPGIPAIPIAFVLVVQGLVEATGVAGSAWRFGARVVAALAIAAIVRIGFQNAKDRNVLLLHEQQTAFPDGCRFAEETLPPGALVVSMQMSGALAFYTALTPVNWYELDAAKFADLRLRTEARGARWFALLMPYEVPLAAPKVPGSWTYLGERKSVSLWRLDPAGP